MIEGHGKCRREAVTHTCTHTHIYRPCPDGTLATAKEDRPKQLLIDGDSSLPPPPPLHLDCFLFHFILSASLSQVPSLSLFPPISFEFHLQTSILSNQQAKDAAASPPPQFTYDNREQHTTCRIIPLAQILHMKAVCKNLQ